VSADYLTLDDLLALAERMLGPDFEIIDIGLLQSAVARPQQSAFGEDAYPSVHEKAAALLHSLVANHALRDGNKLLGWAGTVLFYSMNGIHLPEHEEEQVDFVVAIAAGRLSHVPEIAKALQTWTG
jgi:death on curing protein